MTKDEILNILRESLRVEVGLDSARFGEAHMLRVTLVLDGEPLSNDFVYLPEPDK